MNAEDIEKRLATLTNACASLEADVAVLTAGPRDFAVKFEHKDAKESHLGEQVSGIVDFGYLMQLARFNDWSASKSESEARGMDKESAKGEYKNARYARERAATCRYYARKLGKAPF